MEGEASTGSGATLEQVELRARDGALEVNEGDGWRRARFVEVVVLAEAASSVPVGEWETYDRKVDALPESDVREALKGEARLRALAENEVERLSTGAQAGPAEATGGPAKIVGAERIRETVLEQLAMTLHQAVEGEAPTWTQATDTERSRWRGVAERMLAGGISIDGRLRGVDVKLVPLPREMVERAEGGICFLQVGWGEPGEIGVEELPFRGVQVMQREVRHDRLGPLEATLLRALYDLADANSEFPHGVAEVLADAEWEEAPTAQVERLLEEERADRQ